MWGPILTKNFNYVVIQIINWPNLNQTLNVGLSRQHLPFRHSPHRFFEDSRLSGSFRKYAKVFQRKNIPKKEILPQKGLRLQNIY